MTFAKPKADAASALETVRQFLARLADQPDLALPEVFRRVSEMACETLQVERAGIWLFVNGDRVLRCVNLFEQTRRIFLVTRVRRRAFVGQSFDRRRE